MNKTQIEWALNPDGTPGYTWNPITGCLNGCEYCYARRLANGRLRQRYLANENTIMRFSDGYAPVKLRLTDPFYPRFWEGRLGQIPLFGKSLGIFVCDMSDLFGIGIPKNWTRRVLNHIGECQRHRFYLLTKQPQNLIKFSPFPANCLVGFTATNQEMFYEGCYQLKYVRAKVKYVSFEPLLSFDKLPEVLDWQNWIVSWLYEASIRWVIIGAQTKPTVMPKIEWVEEIVRACDKAGVKVFLKDSLRPLIGKLTIDDKWVWAKDLGHGGLYRQELPK